MFPSDGTRALGRQECLRLLAGVPVGRVVYTRQALPAVFPTNFFLDTQGSVLLRTSRDSDLAHAIDGVVVAFEADGFRPERDSGWSVVITGRASVMTGPDEHARLLRTDTGADTRIPMRDGVFVRIEAGMVSGRDLTGLRIRDTL